MKDSDIDSLSADGAQDTGRMADPRAALAEALNQRGNITLSDEADAIADRLAERGVLLMGDSEWERVGLLISDALDYTNDGAVIAKAVRAALSAEVTE
jgi:hypothetical protein